MKRFKLAIAILLVPVPSVFSPPASANPAAVNAAISTCLANMGACAVVGAAAGTWILWQGAPKVFCTAGGCSVSPHLQDPEASESSGSDYVWADDEATARAICERIAARNGWRLDDVQDAGGFAMQTGKKRFTCYYTMFGDPK